MPDQLYVSYWLRVSPGRTCCGIFDKALRRFPFSRLKPGVALTVYAVRDLGAGGLRARVSGNARDLGSAGGGQGLSRRRLRHRGRSRLGSVAVRRRVEAPAGARAPDLLRPAVRERIGREPAHRFRSGRSLPASTGAAGSPGHGPLEHPQPAAPGARDRQQSLGRAAASVVGVRREFRRAAPGRAGRVSRSNRSCVPAQLSSPPRT